MINIEAIRQLVEDLSKQQLLKYAGTISLCGSNECTEDILVAPVSHYGCTKLIAESILLQREYLLTLRFSTVFVIITL